MAPPPLDLSVLFEQLSERHFDGELPAPELRWNSRLRASAGRFIPGSRRWSRFWGWKDPVIEIATYLLEEERGVELVVDTLGHEMIHYWLWCRRRPHGHTSEFHFKMREMGVSRYNPVPRRRPYKYFYRCPACSREFPARRRLGPLACAVCCGRHAEGRYDQRFKLVLERKL